MTVAGRRAAVLVLLQTRHEGLPDTVRRTDAASGFVHAVDAHLDCPDCFGERPAALGCETCRGAGYVIDRRRRDPYATDRVTPYGLEATTKRGHVPARDAELGRLAAQTRAPWASLADELADADLHPYGWERARAAMYARFDYGHLDRALELLRDRAPQVRPASTLGVALLAAWMPDPVRAPGVAGGQANVAARGPHADGRARDSRDFRVKVLAEELVPLHVIAVEVCLSVAQVRRIVARVVAA